MRFIVATHHYAGLGFALRLQQEGHDVVLAPSGIDDRRASESYDLVGQGLGPKVPLPELVLTSGHYDDVLIATAYGETIPSAWSAAMASARAVKFPGRSFRIDGGGTDFPSSPLRRYDALRRMGHL